MGAADNRPQLRLLSEDFCTLLDSQDQQGNRSGKYNYLEKELVKLFQQLNELFYFIDHCFHLPSDNIIIPHFKVVVNSFFEKISKKSKNYKY